MTSIVTQMGPKIHSPDDRANITGPGASVKSTYITAQLLCLLGLSSKADYWSDL
jgi:hypothetical protein